MLTLQSLKLTNFLSHSDTVLDLEPNTKLLIDGISGAGKSTIVEAILFGLYNKGRSNSRSLIKNNENFAKVVIVLKDNDTEYKIIRSVNSDGKHSIKVEKKENDKFILIKADSKKDIQSYIERNILNSSYLLFINSVIFPQDNTESFVSQNAVKRKEIILEIADVEKYNEYYLKTKKELETYQDQETEKRIKIENLEEFIEENKNSFSKLPKLEEENINLDSELKKLEKELSEIKEKQSEAKLINAKFSDKKDQLLEANSSINVIEDELANFQKPKVPTAITLKKIKELKNNERITSEWNVKMLEIEKQKPAEIIFDDEEIREKVALLLEEDTEICPELNIPCPIIIKERDKKIKELRLQLIENNKKLSIYDAKITRYKEKKENLRECPITNPEELEKLESEVEEYEEMKEKINDNIYKKKELKMLRIKKKKIITEIDKMDTPIDEDILYSDEIFCKQKLDETRYAFNENTKLLSVIKNIITTINSDKKKIKEFEKEKKELDENIESLELLKEAFGNNGLKAIVIDQIIPELEERVNKTLSKLSDFRICFDTQRKGVDATLEGLFITIYNELGEEFDFDSYSGGEKSRISLSLFFGLASMQKSNFIILDEVVVGLDDETISSSVKVMLKLREDVNQLFCISHLNSLKEIFEEKIEVVKINGNSKIIN